jgi:membrane protease YdiL (CAAX protease family)
VEDRPDAGSKGNARAVAAVVVGILAVATMPLAILATRYSASYDLLHSAFAIPGAVLLGALAIGLGRGALRHDDLRLGRAGGRRTARFGRALGVLGIALASTCLVAVAVYGLLTYLGER